MALKVTRLCKKNWSNQKLAFIHFACAWLLLMSLFGCVNYDPHLNFKKVVSGHVGKSMSSSSTFLSNDYLLNSKGLSNKNIENEYQYHGTCRYYYEYDSKSKIIVGWRYTGQKNHCTLAL